MDRIIDQFTETVDLAVRDRSTKAMNSCALTLLMLLALTAPAAACPLDRLAHMADAPVTSLRHKEVPLTQWTSSEGGSWDIYLRPGGALHSIVRTDLGEKGRRTVRASFLTKDDFVIVSTEDHYKLPLPMLPVAIASTVSARYFFCKDVVYLPATLNDESSGTQSLTAAKELKAVFFESGDIASYLRKLK